MTIPSPECPFTLTTYRSLVRLAKDRFTFCDFETFEEPRRIIWRHDLDISLHEMDVLARIDIEEGISSVIFVQVRSPFYNGLSDQARALFTEWLAGGLRIGLHFDWQFFMRDLARVEDHLGREKALLEDLIDREVRCFSYHNPTDVILAYQDDMAGMVNAYHPRFFNYPGVRYISDSNGRWRDRNLREVLLDPAIERLQVNLHDTWWTEDRIPQVAKIDKAFLADATWKSTFYRDHANVVIDWVI